MRWLYVFYVGSFAAHAAFLGGLFVMKKPQPSSEVVAVMMAQPKKKAKPKPPEPPKPIEAPKETLQRPLAPRKAAAPPPVAAPPPPDPVAAAHPALAAMPDFGIALSGGGPGGGGIAIPMGGGAALAPAPVARKEKVLGGPSPKAAEAAAAQDEGEFVKAKPLGSVRPTYTDDARAAGIEGKVRVEITIDETGAVVSAKVVSGLGHGLDESAVAAAKRMTFSPATRGGKPVQSTFVITMRFELGE